MFAKTYICTSYRREICERHYSGHVCPGGIYIKAASIKETQAVMVRLPQRSIRKFRIETKGPDRGGPTMPTNTVIVEVRYYRLPSQVISYDGSDRVLGLSKPLIYHGVGTKSNNNQTVNNQAKRYKNDSKN